MSDKPLSEAQERDYMEKCLEVERLKGCWRKGKAMAGNNVRRNFVGMERRCSKCGGTLVVTEVMVRNRSYRCGACYSSAAVEWARRNREKKRASNAKYQRSMPPERQKARTVAYRSRHPERRAAHQAVQTALRNGTLTKEPCRVCGNGRAQAHHEDYSKPLDVRWLCHAHHMEHHLAMLEARKVKP